MHTSTACQIDGCDLPIRCRNLCNKHYRRLLRNGSPTKSKNRLSTERNNCRKSRCPARTKITDYLGYLNTRNAHIDRASEYQSKNKEKHYKSTTSYRQKNMSLFAAYAAMYRAAKSKATPPWLNDAQFEEMQTFYFDSDCITNDTGIPHHVDHIIPLRGGTVCGLHVPWNLRVITKSQNVRRPRIWSDDQRTLDL